MPIAASLLAAAAFFCGDADAKCLTSDRWSGADKQIHFAGGAAVALGVTVHTRDPWTGFYAGAGVGIAKELLDSSGPGACSLQDALVTIAGAAVGASTGNLLITRRGGQTVVAFVTDF